MVGGIGNSGFDSASISQYRQKLFNKIDSNSDGSITKTELTAVAGNKSSGFSIADIISSLDSDGDGAISSSESEAVLSAADQRLGLGDFPVNFNMAGGSGRLNNSTVTTAGSGTDDVFSVIDTNGDDSIDAAEMETFLTENGMTFDQAMFDSIDSDGDGLISRVEDETARANMPPPPPPRVSGASEEDEELIDIFGLIDTNGDDSLDATEVDTFLSDNGLTFVQADLDSIDTNGDGAISRAEYETARAGMSEEMPPPPPPPPAASESGEEDTTVTSASLFDTIDTNGDGVIDAEELAEYMGETGTNGTDSPIESLDTDGDGKISGTEAETARLKIQEQFFEDLASNDFSAKFQMDQMIAAYADILKTVNTGENGGSLSFTA